jgi:hypothetical protein
MSTLGSRNAGIWHIDFWTAAGCFPVQFVAAFKDLNYPIVVVAEVQGRVAPRGLVFSDQIQVYSRRESERNFSA